MEKIEIATNRIAARMIRAALQQSSNESSRLVKLGLAVYGGAFGVTNSGVKNYENTFAGVLPVPLDCYIGTLRKERSEVLGLDLMGEAQPLRDLNIKGLGVTLVDERSGDEIKADQERGIKILATHFDPVTGKVDRLCDVFSSDTRRRIRQYLIDNQKAHFDIILCRPVAALDLFPKYPPAVFYLLQEFWRMLSPEGGLLATEVPYEFGGLLRNWRPCLSDYIEMKFAEVSSVYSCAYTMSLIKSPESETKLPPLPDWEKNSSRTMNTSSFMSYIFKD